MSRTDLKVSVGQAHQIAKVLHQQGQPKSDAEGDTLLQWAEFFKVARKLTPADCRELSRFMRRVCRPGPDTARQRELESIMKRLQGAH